MKGIEVDGADGSVSALDLCSATLTLAVGNERGLVRTNFNVICNV